MNGRMSVRKGTHFTFFVRAGESVPWVTGLDGGGMLPAPTLPDRQNEMLNKEADPKRAELYNLAVGLIRPFRTNW